MLKKMDWIKFVEEFKCVNSFYRRGKFEKSEDEEEEAGYSILEKESAANLRTATDKLYEQAKTFWDDSAVPSEYLSEVMRAMTISFELDEHFILLTDDKKKFFYDFINEFIPPETQNVTTNSVRNTINKFGEKIQGYTEDDFMKLAYELILFGICGINVYYLKQDPASYRAGLEKTRQLLEYIETILKIEYDDPQTLSRKGLGLKGLAHHFEGRFYFGLGEFRKAETAFKKSIAMYVEKMNCLVASPTQKDAETRTLSLRRASLSEVIGLANMYLIESRVDEALEIVERVAPHLVSSIGKTMLAYCDLLKASIKRAKYSSDPNKLNEIEREIEDCIAAFRRFVGESHSYYRAMTELSLIYFYKAALTNTSLEDKKEFYRKAVANLDSAIEFAGKKSDKYKNRRIFIEALTYRSHAYRYLAKIEGEDFSVLMGKSVKNAEAAVYHSPPDLKQLRADAKIALGTAYKDLFFGVTDVNSDYKQAASKCFFEALDLNVENNPRLSAICYLQLTDLEIFKQTNYLRANFFFKKYEQISERVGHQYVLDFARELKIFLNERDNFEFFLDPTKTLKLKDWQDEVKKFLIKQTVYLTALEKKDTLPRRRIRQRRGDAPEEIYFAENNRQINGEKTATKATRKSILAKAFTVKMGITGTPAYTLAEENLAEFEQWCEMLSR